MAHLFLLALLIISFSFLIACSPVSGKKWYDNFSYTSTLKSATTLEDY